MNKQQEFAYLLSKFLTDYLPVQRNLSNHTILSYRNTFAQLLLYLKNEKGVKVERISFDCLSSDNIIDFLSWLEVQRHNSIATRNLRLAALHAFAKYVMFTKPDLLYDCQRILGVEYKKTPKNLIHYLSEDNMQELLSQPDQKTILGRRDATLLSLLYDSGARVQELINLNVRDIRISSPASVTLTGKGRKTRQVPLMKATVSLLKIYLQENKLTVKGAEDRSLFQNHLNSRFTRPGISYIIKKYCKTAFKENEISFSVTAHTFRHSKSMHMLRAGINLYYIKEFLGHADLSTTENYYVRADTEMKRKALEQMTNDIIPSEGEKENIPFWNQDENLLNWLKTL